MKVARNIVLAIALFLSIGALPPITIPILPPSGDASGATDLAAINSLEAQGRSVQLECNATYYVSASINVSANKTSFTGCDQTTIIAGVSVSGPIVYVTGATVDVGKFQIYGTGTNALKCYGSYSGSRIHDISVGSGGSWVDVFFFQTCFGDQFDNLSVGGVSGSSSDFHFDGGINADTFSNLYTASSYTSGYCFKFQDDASVGSSQGNTFNSLTAQGCKTGFYMGGDFSDNTLNSPYTEAVVFPYVFGDGTHQAIGWTLNSPVVSGADPTLNASNGFSSRGAAMDFYWAQGIVVNTPRFEGSYLIDTIAQLSFSGGGCTTEPNGITRVNPSGVVSSALLLYPGAGCTGTPTVTVTAGSAGSGATVTATCCTSGLATALTVTAGGTGYGPNPPEMPVTFNNAVNVSINAPSFNSGLHFGLWPWIVKHSGAGTTGGISVYNDFVSLILLPSSGWNATGDLVLAPSYVNQEYLRYINGSGTQTLLSVVPPTFP